MSEKVNRFWFWLTKNMIDRMLLTGLALGALPVISHGRAGFHTSIAPWQMLLFGLVLGVLYVQYMANVFGRYSFVIVQRLFPGSLQEMNARNIVLSLAMMWFGTWTFIGAVVLLSFCSIGLLTAGSLVATIVGAVPVSVCFALTHHQNHMQSE